MLRANRLERGGGDILPLTGDSEVIEKGRRGMMKARVFVLLLWLRRAIYKAGGDICDIMNDDCDNLEIETQIKQSLIDRKKWQKLLLHH